MSLGRRSPISVRTLEAYLLRSRCACRGKCRIEVPSFGQPGRTNCHPENAAGRVAVGSDLGCVSSTPNTLRALAVNRGRASLRSGGQVHPSLRILLAGGRSLRVDVNSIERLARCHEQPIALWSTEANIAANFG